MDLSVKRPVAPISILGETAQDLSRKTVKVSDSLHKNTRVTDSVTAHPDRVSVMDPDAILKTTSVDAASMYSSLAAVALQSNPFNAVDYPAMPFLHMDRMKDLIEGAMLANAHDKSARPVQGGRLQAEFIAAMLGHPTPDVPPSFSPKQETCPRNGDIKSKKTQGKSLLKLAHQKVYPSSSVEQKRASPTTIAYQKHASPSPHQKHTSPSAHQKAHSSAGGRVRSGELVIPKHTALIVPDPKSRMQGDAKRRSSLKISQHVDTPPTKTRSVDAGKSLLFPYGVNSTKSSAHKTHNSQHNTNSLRPSPSSNNNNNHSSVNGNSRSIEIQAQSYLPSETCMMASYSGSSARLLEYEQESLKRKSRRKQMCPQKRVKVDYGSISGEDAEAEAEEQSVAPNKEIPHSEELLNKVTDAAQNGELSRGLDAIFGDTGLRACEEAGDDEDHTTDGSSSPSGSSSPVNGQPSPATSQSGKKKTVATTQNREKRKRQRQHGQAYTTPTGKIYPQRKVQEKDCSKCRYNCSTNISPEQRQQIFNHFWQLDSNVKRQYYYCQSIKEKPAKTMKHTRECSREYTLKLENGERVRVCKGFYLATLDVSDKAVRIAMEKRKKGKCYGDRRSSSHPLNKSKVEDKDRARRHIETHLIADIYAKTSDGGSSGVMPGQDLNLASLYQDYVRECVEDNKDPVAEDDYVTMFTTEFNLSSVQV